jgi:hypothetical protein
VCGTASHRWGWGYEEESWAEGVCVWGGGGRAGSSSTPHLPIAAHWMHTFQAMAILCCGVLTNYVIGGR